MKDFSKCHCEKAGFCPAFNKLMEENPPNWQWCQNSTKEKREQYYKNAHIKREKKQITNRQKPDKIKPVQFFDEIPEKKRNIAVCVIAANEYAKKQLEVTRESIVYYTKKCKADYVELTGDQCESWPIANKYRLHEVVKKYEKTLYVDCDIIIKKDAPNIFKETPDDKLSAYNEYKLFDYMLSDTVSSDWIKEEQNFIKEELGLVYEQPNKISVNGGVLVIPNSLADLYKQPDIAYPKLWCFDQMFLSLQLNDDNFFPLDQKYNHEFIAYNFWLNINEAYFLHANGSRPEEFRIQVLKRLAEKNYEKVTVDKDIYQYIGWCKSGLEKYDVIYKKTNDPPVVKNKDKLLITIACGEFEDFINLVGDRFEEYAKKCGADFILLTGETQDWWALEKFRIYDYCKLYDRTIYMDIDFYIRDNTPNLFDVVPEDCIGAYNDYPHQADFGVRDLLHEKNSILYSLYSKKESEYIKNHFEKNKYFLNAGLLVMSKKHTNIWEPIDKPFLKKHCGEQFVMETRVINNKYKIHFLDHKFNHQFWFNIPYNFFFDKQDEAYMIHLAGGGNQHDWGENYRPYFGKTKKELLTELVLHDRL